MKQDYVYNATVLDVYDADTCTLVIDLGFKVYIKEKVRLSGIDTPEIRTKNLMEKRAALKARDFVRKMILEKTVTISTRKEGKFGRYIADIFLDTGTHLNTLLVKRGYAREYDGGKRRAWFE
jgi:micrococcal nuclease